MVRSNLPLIPSIVIRVAAVIAIGITIILVVPLVVASRLAIDELPYLGLVAPFCVALGCAFVKVALPEFSVVEERMAHERRADSDFLTEAESCLSGYWNFRRAARRRNRELFRRVCQGEGADVLAQRDSTPQLRRLARCLGLVLPLLAGCALIPWSLHLPEAYALAPTSPMHWWIAYGYFPTMVLCFAWACLHVGRLWGKPPQDLLDFQRLPQSRSTRRSPRR